MSTLLIIFQLALIILKVAGCPASIIAIPWFLILLPLIFFLVIYLILFVAAVVMAFH